MLRALSNPLLTQNAHPKAKRPWPRSPWSQKDFAPGSEGVGGKREISRSVSSPFQAGDFVLEDQGARLPVWTSLPGKASVTSKRNNGPCVRGACEPPEGDGCVPANKGDESELGLKLQLRRAAKGGMTPVVPGEGEEEAGRGAVGGGPAGGCCHHRLCARRSSVGKGV